MGCCKSNSKIKFIVIKTYMKKKERSQTNNLTLNLKELEASRRKEIIKITNCWWEYKLLQSL